MSLKGFLIALAFPLACAYTIAPPADQARAEIAAKQVIAAAERTLPVI